MNRMFITPYEQNTFYYIFFAVNLGPDVNKEISGVDKPFAAVEETKLKVYEYRIDISEG